MLEIDAATVFLPIAETRRVRARAAADLERQGRLAGAVRRAMMVGRASFRARKLPGEIRGILRFVGFCFHKLIMPVASCNEARCDILVQITRQSTK